MSDPMTATMQSAAPPQAPTEVGARLGQRIAAARERSGLGPWIFARRAGMSADELRAAEAEGRVTTVMLERIAAATGQSIEFFLAAADDEPVGALLRAQDASRSSTRDAVDWFEQFIERYEFLANRD